MKLKSNILYSLKIAAIVLLALCAAWLFVNAFYFSAILVLIAVGVTAFSVYADRRKLIRRMERMIAGIRHADFTYHFVHGNVGDELERLSLEMNDALELFRSRAQDSVMDEAETQAWQKLISVLTHEIMNSIAPIISLAETLAEREISPQTAPEEYRVMKQAMQTIHRRSRGLLSFVENYRALTRLPQPQPQPIHVQSMLQSLLQLTASGGAPFAYSVYPEHLILMADKNMLEQMLLNLLKNAREARAERIEIKAQQVGADVHITVSDNGQGISPEAIDKIFIPFYSTKSGGSGIGLSLCRQIMTRHKGKISAKSGERGSEFTLEFRHSL